MANVPSVRKMRRCQHQHLSGRRCAAPVGKGILDVHTGTASYLCGLHTGADCQQCDAMLEAFPIRKTLREPAPF